MVVLAPRAMALSIARAPATGMLLALPLPTATANSALAVAALSGGLAIVTQLGLVAYFKRTRGQPWLSESPGFVAHQVMLVLL